MKKISLFASAILLAGGIFSTFSCNKAAVDSNTQTTQDNELCESEFMRILPLVNSLTQAHLNRAVDRVTASYPTYTPWDTVTMGNGWPRTLVINYGPTGVVDPTDGKTRRGVITITFENYWHDIGTPATVTYNNYYVNNISYTASVNIDHKSANSYGLAIVNGVCKSTSWTIQFGSSRTVTQTNGIGDSVYAHGAYSVTGTGNGVDRNQVNFTSTIQAGLPMTLLCDCPDLITSGTVVITPAGLATRTVNYGSGICNTQATVTIDGQNYSISK